MNYSLNELINDNNVLKIIKFGSVVYGTNNKNSDIDCIIILNEFELEKQISYIDKIKFDYTFISKNEWERLKKENDIKALECIFCDKSFYLKGSIDEICIDIDLVRKSISKTASNSFVKCKKKLIIEKDYNPYIAKKSLWHSLRILKFGIQIMKYNKIINFGECNYLYDEIVNCTINDWNYFKEKYQPLYNKLKSEFKIEYNLRKKNDEKKITN